MKIEGEGLLTFSNRAPGFVVTRFLYRTRTDPVILVLGLRAIGVHTALMIIEDAAKYRAESLWECANKGRHYDKARKTQDRYCRNNAEKN